MSKQGIINNFGGRLKEAFDNKSNAEIARALGVSDSAVTLYMNGRVPSASKLVKISSLTNCNLHWLLTGEGEKNIKSGGENLNKAKTKTLIFQGAKGGVGTSTSAMLSSVLLAYKGYRVLLVSNHANVGWLVFSLDKSLDWISSPAKDAVAGTVSYIPTSIENLDLLINKGENYAGTIKEKVRAFKKSESDIKREYDFVIFDINGHENPFMTPKYLLSSFLLEGKVIIPYQPLNSTHEILNKILGFGKLNGIRTEALFLGLFINNEREESLGSKLYLQHKSNIQNIVGTKTFKTVIRHDLDALEDFAINTDIEKIKNTKLFIDYSNLVDEILNRLQIKKS